MTSPDKINPSTEIPGPATEDGSEDFAARREGKGLRLEDVFTRTRISVRNLQAIERADFAALPPSVYTKAFIKQYAAFIGADPQPVLARYEAYLKAQEGPRAARKTETQEGPPQKSSLRKPLLAVAAVLIVIIAAALILFAPYDLQRGDLPHETISKAPEVPPLTVNPASSVPEPSPAESVAAAPEAPIVPQSEAPAAITAPAAVPNPSPAAAQGQTASLPPPAPPTVNKPSLVTAAGSQKLTIAAREATWIAIRVDQQEAQQAYLRPGDTVTFSGMQFRMDIGNAGGIDMTLQGKPVPALGKSGQVVHVTLP